MRWYKTNQADQCGALRNRWTQYNASEDDPITFSIKGGYDSKHEVVISNSTCVLFFFPDGVWTI
jgi:hypothetical protein